MRTSLDVPDTLFRHLKARAALEGTSLRHLVLDLIDRGLAAPPIAAAARPKPPPALPSIRLGAPMALSASELSNAALDDFDDD